MTNKFDSLNDEFNVKGDIVQPEVVNQKIEKVKKQQMMSRKIMTTQEVIFIV